MIFEIWLENRQHLMNVEGKNETDARENFNDMIFVKSEETEVKE